MKICAVLDIIAIIFFTSSSTAVWFDYSKDKTSLILAICITISNTIVSLWNIVNLLAMIPKRKEEENWNKDE